MDNKKKGLTLTVTQFWLNERVLLLLKRTCDIGLENLDLGTIYSKNLTNNDATIRTSNKNNFELEKVKKERDNNKY